MAILQDWEGPVLTFTYNFSKGDANMDDLVNVSDLQTTLNYSNRWGDDGSVYGSFFNFTAADTYADDDINVQDIVSTVNILLNVDPETLKARRKAKAMIAERNIEAWITIENGDIVLNSMKNVAALDLCIDGVKPENIVWNLSGFMTSAIEQGRGTHAIIYSMSGGEIEAGRTVIGHVKGGAVITDATLCDINARSIAVSANEMTTGINNVNSWEGAETITNVGGVRTEVPNRGVYIVRKNGTTKKVLIK